MWLSSTDRYRTVVLQVENGLFRQTEFATPASGDHLQQIVWRVTPAPSGPNNKCNTKESVCAVVWDGSNEIFLSFTWKSMEMRQGFSGVSWKRREKGGFDVCKCFWETGSDFRGFCSSRSLYLLNWMWNKRGFKWLWIIQKIIIYVNKIISAVTLAYIYVWNHISLIFSPLK